MQRYHYDSGPGRSIALLLIELGLIKFGVAFAGFLNPRIRLVETELPDTIPEKQVTVLVV